VQGAFTGAFRDKIGIFKAAHKGTAFLDEIDSLNPYQQAKLLRFLQEREIKPVGSEKIEKVDVRVLCATNKNVLEMVKEQEMRSDLYYRIGIFMISLLPLRYRKETIPELVQHFVEKYRDDTRPVQATGTALRSLQNYPWPGNVRELENLIRVVLATTNDKEIKPTHLEKYFRHTSSPAVLINKAVAETWTEEKLVNEYQNMILAECGGNVTRACKFLGIDRSTFSKRRNRKTKQNSTSDFDD
jgi:two-component system response regulator HydG